ncbi:hypothetical protein NMG60_11027517 [Bertholletia excelsa]
MHAPFVECEPSLVRVLEPLVVFADEWVQAGVKRRQQPATHLKSSILRGKEGEDVPEIPDDRCPLSSGSSPAQMGSHANQKRNMSMQGECELDLCESLCQENYWFCLL